MWGRPPQTGRRARGHPPRTRRALATSSPSTTRSRRRTPRPSGTRTTRRGNGSSRATPTPRRSCGPRPMWRCAAARRCAHAPTLCAHSPSERAQPQPRARPRAGARAQERAVYHGNRAACYIKLEQWEAAVDDCTSALETQPRYVKALSRRMQAHEQLDQLSEAVADGKQLAEIEPSAHARDTVARLEKKEAEKLEREKDEMLGARLGRSSCLRARAVMWQRARSRARAHSGLCARAARTAASARRQAQRPRQHVPRQLWPVGGQL